MRNSKRCLKASTLFCKIKALKLVGKPKVEIPRVRRCAVSDSFYDRSFKTCALFCKFSTNYTKYTITRVINKTLHKQ
ncbi:hypothetical protein HMPREF9554_01910 [Treponema phagedenis F0421]|nr:hypothetical protein HMPREF9554_01910 [Treponema phagedenis F0421]